MAQRTTALRGQEILDRWCALAEQRLEHLTYLFETGRWRRFHSEVSFLENIREAKAAVETWRRLATREGSLDNSMIDRSWLDRPNVVPPRRATFVHFPLPQSDLSPASYSPLSRLMDRIEKNNQAMGIGSKMPDAPLIVLAPPIAAPPEPVIALPEPRASADGAPSASVALPPDTDASDDLILETLELAAAERDMPVAHAAPEPTLDLAAMQVRYPLLRNAL